MSRTFHRGASANGYWEPSLDLQFLPGCPHCGSPHPIALKSPDPTICPGCGMPAVPPGAPRHVPAVITGWQPWKIVARLFLAIGKALMNFARSI